jgi:hypothetical protein
MTVLSASQRARRPIDSTWGRIFNSQFVDLSKKATGPGAWPGNIQRPTVDGEKAIQHPFYLTIWDSLLRCSESATP